MNYREFKQFSIDCENRRKGDLKGYDCPVCKNKGYIYYLDDYDNESARECDCMAIRYARELARDSGLGETLRLYTFGKYNHTEPWQDDIFNKAQSFLTDNRAYCFYIGGQTGSGKTHICTAIVRELIKKGNDVQYAVWNDTVTALKQDVIDDSGSYKASIKKLKTATVLFIDDLFKTKPTSSDLDKAFQIINYRYNISRATSDKRYITLISSEKSLTELAEIDLAIASRIAEMSKNKYTIGIKADSSKNKRLN